MATDLKYARYIGRVGALAVVLGVGIAVATTPGVAFAQDGDANSTSSSDSAEQGSGQQNSSPPPASDSPTPSGSDTPAQAPVESPGTGGSSETVSVGDSPDVTYGNSGGAHTSDQGAAENGADAVADIDEAALSVASDPTKTPAPATPVDAGPSVTPPTHAAPPPIVVTPDDSSAVTTHQVVLGLSGSSGSAAEDTGRIVNTANPAGPVVATTFANPGANANRMAMFSTLDASTPTPTPAADPISTLLALPGTLINVATGLLTAALSPFLVPGGPGAPADTPLLWGLLAWVRRSFFNQTPVITHTVDAPDALGNIKITLNEFDADGDRLVYTASGATKGTVTLNADGHSFTYDPGAGAAGTDTITFSATDDTYPHLHGFFGFFGNGHAAGDTVTVTIVNPNHAPSVAPGTPTLDPTTGAVTGSMGAVDADGDALVYALTTPPTRGTVDLDQAAGTYTYTPTQAARLLAATTPAIETDSFGFTVTDNKSTPVSATINNIPVSAAQLVAAATTTPLPNTPAPLGIALSPDGGRAYITSTNAGTLTVVDAATGNVVGSPIDVGAGPIGVAVSPNGSRVFVTNSGDGTVTVLDSATLQQVGDPIAVGGSPSQIVVSPDGTRAYVTNSLGSVRVIDTADLTVIGDPIVLSTGVTGLALSPDGHRLYVANSTDGTLTVIDTASNSVVGTPISVGHGALGVAVGVNGKYVYVSNVLDNTVTVIDTANNTPLANPLATGTLPAAITVSPDGSTLYVASLISGTLTAIDTATNTAIGAPVDLPGGASGAVAAPDGHIYITSNAGLTSVTVVPTVGQAPALNGSPTIGEPDADGVVRGTINVVDADGDDLTYTVVTSPSVGTVDFDPETGNFTYTPTLDWRLRSAVTPGADAFTILVSDGHNQPVKVSVSPVPIRPAVVIAAAAEPLPTGSVPTTTVTSSDGTIVYRVFADDKTVTLSGDSYFASFQIDGEPAGLTIGSDGRVFVTDAANQTLTVLTVVPTSGTAPEALAPPTVGEPDVNGVVTGNLNVVDDDGDDLTYTVIQKPKYGIVSIDSTTGVYTYTPTLNEATAIRAGASFNDTDEFAVSVTDNHNVPVTVSVGDIATPTIDIQGNQLVGGYNGPHPWGVVFSPDGSRAYVTDYYQDRVTVYNTFDNSVVRVIPVDGAREIAVNSTGTRAYVANRSAGTVTVIDTATNTVIGSPIAIAGGAYDVDVSSDGTRLYVANDATGKVTVLNTDDNSVIGTVDVGMRPVGVTVAPDGAHVYVANYNDGTVSVIDTVTSAVVGDPIPAGAGAFAIAFNASGSRAYVSNAIDDTVTVIDTTDNSVVGDPISVGSGPWNMAVGPDGSVLYVTTEDGVGAYDLTTGRLIRFLPDTGISSGVAISPDGQQIYAAGENDGDTIFVQDDYGWVQIFTLVRSGAAVSV